MAHVVAEIYARPPSAIKRKTVLGIKKVALDRSARQALITIPVPLKGSTAIKAKQAHWLELVSIQMADLLDLLVAEESHSEEYFTAITRSSASTRHDLHKKHLTEVHFRHVHSAQGESSLVEASRSSLRTKSSQETIGVYAPVSLKDAIEAAAMAKGGNFAETARSCFEIGLRELDEKIWDQGFSSVFEEFAQVLHGHDASTKEQWPLRLTRSIHAKAIALASEFEQSRSHLAAMCLAVGLSRISVIPA